MNQFLTEEGANYLLRAGLKGAATINQWYLMLYENDYTPRRGDKMSTFLTNATECVAYESATRPALILGDPIAGEMDNASDIIDFLMTDEKTVYGAAIVSSPVKGSNAGTLLAVGRLSSPKVREIGELLRLTAGIKL